MNGEKSPSDPQWISQEPGSLIQTIYVERRERVALVRESEVEFIGKFDAYTNVFSSLFFGLLFFGFAVFWHAFEDYKITHQEGTPIIMIGVAIIVFAYLSYKSYKDRSDQITNIFNQASDSNNPESAAARSTFMPPPTND